MLVLPAPKIIMVDKVGSQSVNLILDLLIMKKRTTLKFQYLNDKIHLVDLISTGDVKDWDRIAHVFYDVKRGNIYYNYLGQNEKVGGNRSYYFRYYSRVSALKVNSLQINGDQNKWMFIAKSNTLEIVLLLIL